MKATMKNKFALRPFYLFTAGAISCLGIIVYSNSFFGSFHFDDLSCIVNNPILRNISNWQGILNYWPCRFIAFLSIALNYHFGHYQVFGYHLLSLGIHITTAILVWWLALLTFSTPALKEEKIAQHSDLIALMAGLIFVSHPVQTEAVNYIYQRAASMAAMFYVATLCLYISSRLVQGRAGRFYFIGSLITALLAIFTKENTISLPFMVLFYEFSFLKTKRGLNWRVLLPYLVIFLVHILTMVLTETGKARLGLRGLAGISNYHYLLTEFRVLATYIRLIFIPIHQNFNYDYPISKNILEMPVLASIFLLGAILFLAQRLFSKYRLISFSIFWFFLTLLPESSFCPFQDVIFEHRLYLPMVGISILFAGCAYYLSGKNTIRGVVVVLLIVIACYSVLTYQRNKIWKDEIAFWDDVIKKSPDIPRPYDNRGFAYYEQGKFDQAIADFNKVIDLDPGYAKAYYERGVASYRQNKYAQALADYNKAIEIDPNSSDAYDYRAILYVKQQDMAQAGADFAKAIETNPANEKAYYNRGLFYAMQGSFDEAIADYDQYIKLNPDDAKAYLSRAVFYYQLKKYANARDDVQRAQGLGADVQPKFINALKEAHV